MKLSSFICPSDPPDSVKSGWDGPSSYIANGFIFQDGTGLPLSYVSNHDGQDHTLMISENVRTEAVSGRINWHNWWDSGFDFKTGTSTVGQAFGAVPNTCNPPPLAVSFGCGNLVYSGTDTAWQ